MNKLEKIIGIGIAGLSLCGCTTYMGEQINDAREQGYTFYFDENESKENEKPGEKESYKTILEDKANKDKK